MAHQRIKTDKLEIATCDCQTSEEVMMVVDKVNKVIYSSITQDELLEMVRNKRGPKKE